MVAAATTNRMAMSKHNFDICIPAWNSLEYLKLCIEGIRDNSAFKHRIIVHDNASEDGTFGYMQKLGIECTHTDTNEGFSGVNHALKCSDSEAVMIFNCDMYALPDWDVAINKQQEAFAEQEIQNYTLSSCLIEPVGFNPEYDIIDFGQNNETFDSDALNHHYRVNKARYDERQDSVNYCHPILLPQKMLREMDFLDPEYFPGYGVDDDLAARAYYRCGCRHFRMLGKSRVYHFSSATFKKMPPEIRARHGRDLFARKWPLDMDAFRRHINIMQKVS